MPKKTAAQLQREIDKALAQRKQPRQHSVRRKAIHVHLGPGLKDGLHTAGTAYLLRRLRELGATATLAKTGRATVRDAAGNVTIYTVDVPQNRAEADALLASTPNPESPLARALADLTKGA